MPVSPQTPINVLALPITIKRADGTVAIEMYESAGNTGVVKQRFWNPDGDLTLELNTDGEVLYSTLGSI